MYLSSVGELQQTLVRHRGPIFSLKWNSDSSFLLSGSYDKSAIVWDEKNGEIKQEFNFHNGIYGTFIVDETHSRIAPTLDVDWKDNTTFASCSTDKSIQICSIGEAKPIKSFNEHTDEVNTIAWDPTPSIEWTPAFRWTCQ